MTNPATQAAAPKPPLRFGFMPRPVAASTPEPIAEAPSVASSAFPAAAVQQVSAMPTVEAANEAGGAVAAPAFEQITVMLPSGGREGQVFGGVFGRMEEGKFRTDPLLKSIYLLQLVDGAEPGQGVDEARRDVLRALGGLPETVTISVPTELAASFKATLAHLSGQRWEKLYAAFGGMANPMTKYALEAEARYAREAVAEVSRLGGFPYTVQIAETKELRYSMERADDDYEDYGALSLTGVPQTTTERPLVSARAGHSETDEVGSETLFSACSGRQEGDTVTYLQVEGYPVIAGSQEAAEKVFALVPASLRERASVMTSDVMVNGQPYVVEQAPELGDDGPAAEVPR
jgi:hypothetical protein